MPRALAVEQVYRVERLLFGSPDWRAAMPGSLPHRSTGL